MKSQKVLYIGNNLKGSSANITTIETLSQQLESVGYHIVRYSSKKNKILRLLDMLQGVIRNGSKAKVVLIDTYSTSNFYYAVAVANVCRLLKHPYIPILHGGNLPERLKNSKVNSYKLFKGAKMNVAPSYYLFEAFKKEGYTNLVHIPNTITLSEYRFKIKACNDAPKLLWVRSFAEIYNPLLALKVLELVLVNFPKASLTMIGPDKDGSLVRCEKYATSQQLPVKFTGKLTKKEWRALGAHHDVFINTTNFDNTPVSVIEAMALGLPVVSTNVGGMPFLISNEVDGFLVPPNNAQSFVAPLAQLFENSTVYQEIALRAREKVSQFDWEKVKLQWQELLRE